ncbi:MAG: nucleotidyltransferase [Spirochaetae bacterium HGW-Spirochaetae-1]|jgi:predicted nucleotidyltransferase|nr:MAG: nucleotidyltransferase [Spirochaetae bacterium HGW-Spirochaetae-1]
MADIAVGENIKDILCRYASVLEAQYSLRGVYLFGSRARGNEDKDSDIDVAVVADDFTGDPVDDRLALMRLRRGIDLRIEPLPFHSRDFVLSHPMAKEVMETGIRIR